MLQFRILFVISCAVSALLAAPPLAAHSRLKAGKPFALRNTNDGNKEAVAPCGSTTRNANPTQLKPGSKITVQWEETVQHPGRFKLQFSPANDQNWQDLTTVVDTQNDGATLPHSYSVDLTLPTVECAACTIRLIQVMEENPASPTNYYSCGDIKLTNNPQTGGASPQPTPKSSGTPGAGTPAPTPSPTFDPNCK